MSLFAVMMGVPKPSVIAEVKRVAPDHFQVHDRLLVVRTDLSARAIFDNAVVPEEELRGFIIFQITADYYGFAKKGFWDWLNRAFQDDRNG